MHSGDHTLIKKITSWPFHPWLFALFIILAVAITDINLIFFLEGGRSVYFLLFATGIVFGLIYLFTNSLARSGYLTTLLLFLIFIYGHLKRALLPYTLGGISIADDRWLFLIWAVLIAVLGSGWFWRRLKQPVLITRMFNIIAITALVFPTFSLVRLWLLVQADPLTDWQPSSDNLPILTSTENRDIYYIILDGYGRQDMLTDIYGYDNKQFLTKLEDMGFYIASKSSSNYMRTSMSMPSALNFTYLSELEDAGSDTANWYPLRKLIVNNKIRQLLEAQGYTFITFATGFYYTEIQNSDVYLSPHRIYLNSFEQLILGVSALEIASRAGWLDFPVFSYQDHRDRILYTLDQITELQDYDKPIFVLAHITIPHPPFVFDQSGNPIEPLRSYTIADGSEFEGSTNEYLVGYRNQLTYVNLRILEAIHEIISQSSTPPVIILQGDHGPGLYLDWESFENTCLYERLSILNAYYMPGVSDSSLYPQISPVNTFRVVLNAYFNAELPLLEDRSFASYNDSPYQFQDVTAARDQTCSGNLPLP